MHDDDLERRLGRALHAALDDARPSGQAPARRTRGRRTAAVPGGLLVTAAAILVAVGVVIPRLESPGGAPAGNAAGSIESAAALANGPRDGAAGSAWSATASAPAPAVDLPPGMPAGGGIPAAPPASSRTGTTGTTGTGSAGTGTASATTGIVVAGTPRIVNIPPNPIDPVITHAPVPPGSTVVLTTADAGISVTITIGQQVVLELGTGYAWTVSVSPGGILGTTGLAANQQGAWRATTKGTVTISAVGDPACRQSKPPCMVPSRLFTWTIVVS